MPLDRTDYETQLGVSFVPGAEGGSWNSVPEPPTFIRGGPMAEFGPWYGFAFDAPLLIQTSHIDGALPYTPVEVPLGILVELFDATAADYTSPAPGATLLFRQQVNLTLYFNDATYSDGKTTLTDWSFEEAISTTIVGGTTIDPSEAVNYLDNDNTSESDGDEGEVLIPGELETAASWTKRHTSAPYIMQWQGMGEDENPADAPYLRTTYTLHPDSRNMVFHEGNTYVSYYWASQTDFQIRPVYPFGRVTETEVQTIDSEADEDGVGYLALKVGNNIELREYVDGKASEQIKGILYNYDTPCLYRHAYADYLFLAARDRATGLHVIFFSTDYGDTFHLMGNTPFHNDTYKNQRAGSLADGGHWAGGVHRETGAVEFAYSFSGTGWPDPAIAYDSGGVKSFTVYQESASNSDRLVMDVVTSTGTVKMKSDAMGEQGSWDEY